MQTPRRRRQVIDVSTRRGRKIAISGDLGSGKTTVAKEIAQRLDVPYVGSGDVQRSIAARLGLSTLQANLVAEEKAAIDEQIDGELQRLDGLPEAMVVDARMGWHFVPHSYKVHIVVSPAVGAKRLLQRRLSNAELYQSVEEAEQAAAARSASERRRFLAKYGVDITRLRNYDLVVDASDSAPGDIADVIVAAEAESEGKSQPRVFASSIRIFPTGNAIRELVTYQGQPPRTLDETTPLGVGYSRPWFFALDGHSSLSARLTAGRVLSEVILRAELDEEVVGGLTAEMYLASETSFSSIYDWEDAHNFRFDEYPLLANNTV